MSGVRELDVADTLGILAMPGVTTQRTSQGLGWSGLLLSVQEEQPYEAEFVGSRSHLVILHLDGPVQVTRGSGSAPGPAPSVRAVSSCIPRAAI